MPICYGFQKILPRWGLIVVRIFLLQRFHLYEVNTSIQIPNHVVI